MPKDIFFFRRSEGYPWLSNFYDAPFILEGVTWPTSEHYYQAAKTLISEEKDMILACKAPKDAKYAGYHVTLQPLWDDVKEEFMWIALRAKFTQHPDLKEKLLATGNALLHENSPWDKYWGYASGKGQDRLGILLMQVREELGRKGTK